jgi:hypothetical protein
MAKHLPISFIWATKMDSRHISEIQNTRYEIRNGSAIILAIVLTTLLAMLGVLFLLSSRVDSAATSAIGGSEDLKLAVDTVVAQISEAITRDVPGVDPNGTYYDYPDNFNPWLACLEPYPSGSDYLWQQVSNIYGPPAVQNVQAQILPDYNNTAVPGTQADADGDGVSDSIWVEVPGKMSAKGKPIYAAIRIIDNGGMLNVNTGFKFDPCTSVGAKQSEVNLMALAALDHTHTLPGETKNRLLSYRCGTADANFYEQNVVWRYGLPNGVYTPFDISDELNLRYRYILNRSYVTRTVSRIENLWTNAFDGPPYVPRDTQNYSINDPCDWFWIVSNSYPSPCPDANIYDNRHIATTYNMDRITTPDGNKMVNINKLASVPDVNMVCSTLRTVLDPCLFDANQIAVNLIDYLDADSNVTYFVDPHTSSNYFGFETPCIYISEIATNFYQPGSGSLDYDANDPSRVYRAYAIELFKPYWQDDEPNGWDIVTTDLDANGVPLLPITTKIVWTGSTRFHVLRTLNNKVGIQIDINEPNQAGKPDPNFPQNADINFGPRTTILLRRDVNGYGSMIVDSLGVPAAETGEGGWMEPNASRSASKSFERDIRSIHRCIRKVWSPMMTTSPTIGHMNGFVGGGDMIQAHPQNGKFTNIGEIGQLFRKDAYLTEPNDTEFSVRLNIADPNVHNLFNHFTIIDPYDHNQPANETRIKGRININTSPWFVLAQLPWVTNPDVSIQYADRVKLARAIVAYRDKLTITGGPDYYQGGSPNARQRGMGAVGLYTVRENPGFASVGELLNVTQNVPLDMGWPPQPCLTPFYDIRHYGRDGLDLSALPDLTPADGAPDDFEERDVIFDRISNFVTVRSDVFTAYILVRIPASVVRDPVTHAIIQATGGPQKRVIAIFDRSEVPAKKIKVIAIQPVPDPR